jgi:hypothetical protein
MSICSGVSIGLIRLYRRLPVANQNDVLFKIRLWLVGRRQVIAR